MRQPLPTSGRKRGTQLAHSCGIKARIFRLIEQKVADRPSVADQTDFQVVSL